MLENEKKGYVWCMAFGGIVVVICFLFSVFGSSGADPTEIQADTDKTMGTINVQHQLVRSQLDFGTGHVDRAGDAIGRAYAIINHCQRRVEYGKARIKECNELIAESRRSLEEAKRIIREAEISNRSGTNGSAPTGKESVP